MKSIITLAIVTLFISVGVGSYHLGYKKAASLYDSQLSEPLNTVYAEYNNQIIRASDVEEEIRESLLNLKRSEYSLKKQAVLDFIQRKGIDFVAENSAQIVDDQSDFEKYLKERKIDFKKLNAQSQTNIRNNYRLFKSRIIENENLKNNVKWLIPVHFLEKKQVKGLSFLTNFGNQNSSYKVTLFTNFYCAQCKESLEKFLFATERYGQSLSIELRFSMEESESSLVFLSAAGTGCAVDQGKEINYLKIFLDQAPQTIDELSAAAVKAGMDLPKWQNCIESKKYHSQVQSDVMEARNLGISPRSVFYINGYQFYGQDPLDQFVTLLFQK